MFENLTEQAIRNASHRFSAGGAAAGGAGLLAGHGLGSLLSPVATMLDAPSWAMFEGIPQALGYQGMPGRGAELAYEISRLIGTGIRPDTVAEGSLPPTDDFDPRRSAPVERRPMTDAEWRADAIAKNQESGLGMAFDVALDPLNWLIPTAGAVAGQGVARRAADAMKLKALQRQALAEQTFNPMVQKGAAEHLGGMAGVAAERAQRQYEGALLNELNAGTRTQGITRPYARYSDEFAPLAPADEFLPPELLDPSNAARRQAAFSMTNDEAAKLSGLDRLIYRRPDPDMLAAIERYELGSPIPGQGYQGSDAFRFLTPPQELGVQATGGVARLAPSSPISQGVPMFQLERSAVPVAPAPDYSFTRMVGPDLSTMSMPERLALSRLGGDTPGLAAADQVLSAKTNSPTAMAILRQLAGSRQGQIDDIVSRVARQPSWKHPIKRLAYDNLGGDVLPPRVGLNLEDPRQLLALGLSPEELAQFGLRV
jgi:hypothetical protein